MKPRTFALLAFLGLLSSHLVGQEAKTPASAGEAPAAATPEAPAGPGKEGAGAGDAAGNAGVTMNENEFALNNAKLNEVLQFLAQKAGKQYFHTPALEGPTYMVTGILDASNPEEAMEALAFQFSFELYRKGNTIYALNPAQVAQLPQEHFVYQLRYLRPSDIDQLKSIIQPALSPTSGVVNFEPKTNTLLVIDTAKKIAVVQDLLAKLDQPKGQIIVETKILRVTSTAGSKVGVDWSATLGDGITFEARQSLNGLFNLPEYRVDLTAPENSIGYQYDTGSTSRKVTSTQMFSVDPVTGLKTLGAENGTIAKDNEWTSVLNELRVQGAGLVLSPMEVSAVLRALNEGNLAKQKSNPTVITEDNETASVAILDRVPIITTTSTIQNDNIQISEEVRYRIDESDPTDPENTREIGVTVSVTPTLLPDNTVRMALRPRTAQIVEFVQGAVQGGGGAAIRNQYPRVAEATIETIARVPNGYSLLIGGFYNEEEVEIENKVPGLGDIPLLNFFFKSSNKSKEQTSLVFIITPTSYDPVGAVETLNVTDQLMDRLDLRADHDSINPHAPGPAHKPGLRRTMRGILFDSFGLPPEQTAPAAANGLAAQPGYQPLPPAPQPPAALRGAPPVGPPAGMTKANQSAPPPAPVPHAPSQGKAEPAAPTAPKAGGKPAPTPLFR